MIIGWDADADCYARTQTPNSGLTVFASRALKNALYGKRIRKEPSSTFISAGSLKQS